MNYKFKQTIQKFLDQFYQKIDPNNHDDEIHRLFSEVNSSLTRTTTKITQDCKY